MSCSFAVAESQTSQKILNKAVSFLVSDVFLSPEASIIREFLPINYSFAQGHLLFVSFMLRKSKTACHRIKFLIKIRVPLSRGGKRSESNTVQPGAFCTWLRPFLPTCPRHAKNWLTHQEEQTSQSWGAWEGVSGCEWPSHRPTIATPGIILT